MKKTVLLLLLIVAGCIAYTVQTNFGWTSATFQNRQGSALSWGMDSTGAVYPIRVDSDGKTQIGAIPTLSGITTSVLVLTSISTEYSKSFTNARKITIQNRSTDTIKYAYASGIVATGEDYVSLKSGSVYAIEGIDFTGSMYFACSSIAGATLEVEEVTE
jgi:hypothetical protein